MLQHPPVPKPKDPLSAWLFSCLMPSRNHSKRNLQWQIKKSQLRKFSQKLGEKVQALARRTGTKSVGSGFHQTAMPGQNAAHRSVPPKRKMSNRMNSNFGTSAGNAIPSVPGVDAEANPINRRGHHRGWWTLTERLQKNPNPN